MQEYSLLSIFIQSIYLLSSIAVIYLAYVFGYCFLIKPYFRVRYFLKKGGHGKFCYGPQFFFENARNAVTYGNSMIPYLETIKKNPNIKFFVRSLGSQALVILYDVNLAKQFLQNQQDYDKSWHFKEMNKQFDAGLFFATGETWRQTRRMLSPFLTFDSLKRSVPMILECVKGTCSRWIKNGKLQQDSIGMFSQVSGEVITKYLFGINLDSMRTQDGKLITDLIYEFVSAFTAANDSLPRILLGAWFVQKGILPSHKKFLGKNEEFVNLSRQLIQQAKINGVPEDTYLFKLLEIEKVGEIKYDITSMAANLMILLIAGTDTNAHNLGFTIYYLFKYPAVLQKLRAEIDREISDLDKIDLELLNRLDYTNAVIKETLRISPPTPWIFYREVLKPQTFDNFTVKQGDLVTVSASLFHLSEKYYSKPLEYIPERWLPDRPFPNDGFKKEPFSFLSFSSGPRNCIGQHLAMIEAKLMLVVFIKTFKFSFPANYELKLEASTFTEPVKPLIVSLDPIS